MTFYRVFVLFFIFLAYLLLGGVIFKSLSEEQFNISENPIIAALDQFQINILDEKLLQQAGIRKLNLTSTIVSQFDQFRAQYIQKNITTGDWSFYEAIFFSLTVITTIGYGNKTIKSPTGRGICILYALIGIPITGFWMAGVGDLFRKKLIYTFEKYKNQNHHESRSCGLNLVIQIVYVLIPGLVLFLLFPAAMFMALEKWSFLDAFYYTIITLTTIGFGDFVAAEGGPTRFSWIYEMFVMIWICFGLGYVSMILNFIAKGMKSKKIKELDQMFINNLKTSQFSFTKEIDYIIRGIQKFNSKSIEANCDYETRITA
ncbi:Potassium channel sub K member 10 [Chamberlinius hualienensis]